MRFLARGLVVALLAIGCSMGIIVKTAVPAEAFVVPPPVIPATISIGGTGGAVGVTAGATVAAPAVVAGVAVVAVAGLGYLAWSERDTILGWFGKNDDGPTLDELGYDADETAHDPRYWGANQRGSSVIGVSIGPSSITRTNSSVYRIYSVRLLLKSGCYGDLSEGGSGFNLTTYNPALGSGWSSFGSGGWIEPGASSVTNIGNALNPDCSAGGSARWAVVVTDAGADNASANYSVITGGAWVGDLHDSVFDPMDRPEWRGATVTATCKNLETGALETVAMTTKRDTYPDYANSDHPPLFAPSCRQHVGPGWVTDNLTVTPTDPYIGNKPVPVEVLPGHDHTEIDTKIPPETDPDWQECYKSVEGCVPRVYVDTKVCIVGMPECESWEDIAKSQPERVICRLGTRVVGLAVCRQYLPQRSFRPGTETKIPVQPEPGTNPITETPFQTTPGPVTDPIAEGARGECFPAGWGLLNPVEWVYKPVRCVVEWAFVPKTATWGVDGLWNTLRSRPPGSIVLGGYTVAASAIDGFTSSGCGLGVYFGGHVNETVDGCLVTSVSGWGTVYSVAQAGIVGASLLGALHMVRGAFGRGGN